MPSRRFLANSRRLSGSLRLRKRVDPEGVGVAPLGEAVAQRSACEVPFDLCWVDSSMSLRIRPGTAQGGGRGREKLFPYGRSPIVDAIRRGDPTDGVV